MLFFLFRDWQAQWAKNIIRISFASCFFSGQVLGQGPLDDMESAYSSFKGDVEFLTSLTAAVTACVLCSCSCFCACRSYAVYEYSETNPGPRLPTEDEHTKRGKRDKMGSIRLVVWVLRSVWAMLGPFCQGFICCSSAVFFFIVMWIAIIPSQARLPAWTIWSLSALAVHAVVGIACRLVYVLIMIYIYDPWKQKLDDLEQQANRMEAYAEKSTKCLEATMQSILNAPTDVPHFVHELESGATKEARQIKLSAIHVVESVESLWCCAP